MTEQEFSGLSREAKVKKIMELRFEKMPREQKTEVLNNLSNQDRPEAFEAGVRSLAQGVALNFADEIEGVIRGGIGALQGENFSESREKATQESRKKLAQGRADFPGISTAAEIGGGLASFAIPGGIFARGAKLAQAATALKVGKAAEKIRLGQKFGVAVPEAQKIIQGTQAVVKKGLGRVIGESTVKAAAGGAVAGAGEFGLDPKALQSAKEAGIAQTAAIVAGKAALALGKTTVGTLVKAFVLSGNGLVGLLGTGAGSKIGKELIKKGTEELKKNGKDVAGFSKMVRALQTGGDKLGKFSDELITVTLESGAPGLAAAHIRLSNSNKEYKKKFE